jgi:4-hydroxybenzoate polyprenyltransferase
MASVSAYQRWMSVARSGDWWNWKVPTLLASGYASLLITGVSLQPHHLIGLGYIMIGLVIGAVFASVVNDYFDVEDDRKAGKANRLSVFRPSVRLILLMIVILSGLLFGLFFIRGLMSGIWYLMAWCSFALYSAPPFRTKKRGPWGGVFDALGAGFFPTLFVASAVSEMTDTNISWWFMTCLGSWAFVFGLRGILWHQYQDHQNDLNIGARTFATHYGTANAMFTGKLLLSLELSSFLIFMFPLTGQYIIWLLVFYIAYALLVSRVLNIRQVVMHQARPGEATYFPGTFYQTLWPYLLIVLMPADPSLQIMLTGLHMILFQADLRINYYYIKRMIYSIPMVRSILQKIRVERRMPDRSA